LFHDIQTDAAAAHSAQAPREIVTRPDGLRRGVWEGSSWLFGIAATLLVIVAIAYAVRRSGVARISRFFGARKRY